MYWTICTNRKGTDDCRPFFAALETMKDETSPVLILPSEKKCDILKISAKQAKRVHIPINMIK